MTKEFHDAPDKLFAIEKVVSCIGQDIKDGESASVFPSLKISNK